MRKDDWGEEKGINLLGKCSRVAGMCQVSLEFYVDSRQDCCPMPVDSPASSGLSYIEELALTRRKLWLLLLFCF